MIYDLKATKLVFRFLVMFKNNKIQKKKKKKKSKKQERLLTSIPLGLL